MNIIPISEEYIERFRNAIDIVARERKYLAMLEARPLESVRDWVSGNIENDTPQFLALDDDQVIGWCDVMPKMSDGFQHVGTLGMGVLLNFRDKGIGRALLKKTLAKVKENGIEKIELEVFESNAPAIHLYDTFGFQREGIKNRARKLDGHYDNIVLMAKFLNME
jgi:ribosomal protein S18 acetylase RimI-like enzyme